MSKIDDLMKASIKLMKQIMEKKSIPPLKNDPQSDQQGVPNGETQRSQQSVIEGHTQSVPKGETRRGQESVIEGDTPDGSTRGVTENVENPTPFHGTPDVSTTGVTQNVEKPKPFDGKLEPTTGVSDFEGLFKFLTKGKTPIDGPLKIKLCKVHDFLNGSVPTIETQPNISATIVSQPNISGPTIETQPPIIAPKFDQIPDKPNINKSMVRKYINNELNKNFDFFQNILFNNGKTISRDSSFLEKSNFVKKQIKEFEIKMTALAKLAKPPAIEPFVEFKEDRATLMNITEQTEVTIESVRDYLFNISQKTISVFNV